MGWNLTMTAKLVEDVFAAIERREFLSPGDSVIVGVSGGPDSVALLLVLSALTSSERLPLELTVAHVNHGMRPKADQEERFVVELASRLGLECRTGRFEVASLAAGKPSIEEVARQCRYGFFDQVAKDVAASKIAVGHNADDQVETILMRIMRGTGLKGLEGMQWARALSPGSAIEVVRPLLGTSRDEIEAFLEAEGERWCVDETNLGDDFLRSRVRNELLPLLRDRYNPNVHAALLNLSALAAQANDLVERLVDEAQRKFARSKPSQVLLDAEAVRNLHPIVRSGLLRRVLARLKVPGQEIGLVHVRQLEGMLASEGSSKGITLPGAVRALKQYDELVLTRAGLTPQPASRRVYPLVVPGVTMAPELGVTVHAFAQDFYPERYEAFKKTKNLFQEIVAQDKLPASLVVRSRRSGDVFQPLGAPGHKKLNKYFTDQKTPVRKRDFVPLLAAGHEIIWVIGQRISDLVKVDENTHKVVVLTANRIGNKLPFSRL